MSFCAETAGVFQFVGYLVTVVKIVVPVVLIILGVIKMAKAILAEKDDEIKSAAISLVKRFIAGVLIFFVPAIVNGLFSIVNGYNGEIKNDSQICVTCIANPSGGDCTSHIK